MKCYTTSTGLLLWILAGTAPSASAQSCPAGLPRVAPNNRYVNHGDGTVTDIQTGLMWKRCSEGQTGGGCSGTVAVENWSAALATAASSTFAGHNDWRLPSVKELQSLVETGCHSPAINAEHFPSTSIEGWYWTSTTGFNGPFAGWAWIVSFSSGYVYADPDGSRKEFSYSVRLVRAGL